MFRDFQRRRFTGALDLKRLQDEIDALRVQQQMAIQPEAFTKEGVPRKGKQAPYALAGLAGPKRTKRPGTWSPIPRYVSADSLTHRDKDARFTR